MKELFKKVLALTLALIVICSGNVVKVSASEVDTQTDLITNDATEVIELDTIGKVYSTDDGLEGAIIKEFKLSNEYNVQEYKVKAMYGALILNVSADCATRITVEDANGTVIGSAETESEYDGYYTNKEMRIHLDGGAYTVRLERAPESNALDTNGVINFASLSGKGGDAESDAMYLYAISDKSTIKQKIVLTKNSTIAILSSIKSDADMKENYVGANVRVLNSKNKAITAKYTTVDEVSYGATFTLKKGTYIIETTGGDGTLLTCYMNYNDNAVNNGGATKAKAETIKSKLRNITFTADGTEKNVQWFKFTLKSPAMKKVALTGLTLNSSKFRVTLYKANKKLYSEVLDASKTEVGYLASAGIAYLDKHGNQTKFPKGTYYVKIEELSKYSNGAFGIQLQ